MVIASTTNCAQEASAKSPKSWSCLDLFHAAPIERVAMIKSGVPARWAKAMLGDFMRGCGRDLSSLKPSMTAVNRKAALDVRLSLWEGELVLGIAGLIGQIEMMVRDSGTPEGFDASDWFANWAISPLPALGGERPIEYLDTGEGRTVISRLFDQMQSSAYA